MKMLIMTLLTVGSLSWSSLALCGEIHDAAAEGNLEKVRLLLKDKPDLVFSKDTNGLTALHWAVNRDHKEVLDFLLANKADVNAKVKDGGTALHMAVGNSNKYLAALLLANKADVNAADNSGHTPLGGAAVTGQKDMVELLLAFKADIKDALHLAVMFKHDDVARLLREEGGHE
jgi:ankyrin repeat protein